MRSTKKEELKHLTIDSPAWDASYCSLQKGFGATGSMIGGINRNRRKRRLISISFLHVLLQTVQGESVYFCKKWLNFRYFEAIENRTAYPVPMNLLKTKKVVLLYLSRITNTVHKSMYWHVHFKKWHEEHSSNARNLEMSRRTFFKCANYRSAWLATSHPKAIHFMFLWRTEGSSLCHHCNFPPSHPTEAPCLESKQ